jgi:hypothetical protein
MNLPSVILLHAKYNTPTDAVSRTVATNDPSTFAFEPCKISTLNQTILRTKELLELTLQMTLLRRKYASCESTKSAAERI